MTHPRLGHARQRLAVALTCAEDGHPTVAREQLRHAEITLRSRWGGRPALARRLEGVLVADVTTPAARAEVQAVADQLDAALAPRVAAAGFRAASDGGEQR